MLARRRAGVYYGCMEETSGSKYIYSGKILSLRVDTVALPDGNSALREIVEHKGAAAVVPVLDDGRIVLVKQYRKPVEEFLLEIPAGKIDGGESPGSCALRELEEETGYRAGHLDKIIEFYPSPGYSEEKIVIFRAGGLEIPGKSPEHDEFIEIVEMEGDEIIRLIKAGRIKDGKTIAGILAALKI